MKRVLYKYIHWFFCVALIFLFSFYEIFVATDRYVSEANIVLDSPEISPVSFNLTSMLSGGGGNNDLLLLRDHLLSVDMLKKVDEKLSLKEHYSQQKIDYFSRLNSSDIPLEILHKYYLKHLDIEFDQYSNVLRLKIEAFSPEMAYELSFALLRFGEEHMNDMGQRLASEQVGFIEDQVRVLGERLARSREDLLNYQNDHGLVSPTDAVESLNTLVSGLEAQLSALNTNKRILLSYQSQTSPSMISIESEIAAIKKQISVEKARMTAQTGNTLNRLSAEYETLQLQAKFALDLYSNALSALENTRVEAVRKLKQISVLQAPTYPEYSVEPRELYNISVFSLIALFATIIVQLLYLIIKDHLD